MKYLSCFSGIGGLEASTPPEMFCEADLDAQTVLRTLHPDIEIWPDVTTLSHPPTVEVVAGGWPCQDISVAGQQAGLEGLRSRLLLDMIQVAIRAGAHSIVAENVPNLLRMRSGREFAATLAAFQQGGFRTVAWRLLNTRSFGLPQNRTRLLMVASRSRDVAMTLFRPLPALPPEVTLKDHQSKAAGFYWTAGTHSINYSRGYVPTIKIGSTLGIVSPPAVHYGSTVRAITPAEALRLQGFDLETSIFPSVASCYKAVGNAVAKPIGRWVLDGLSAGVAQISVKTMPVQMPIPGLELPQFPEAGVFDDSGIQPVRVDRMEGAVNLIDFLDTSVPGRLSARATRGLVDRLKRSGQPCPSDLWDLLVDMAQD